MKYILAVDQGTTSTRAHIYDQNGECVSAYQLEFPQIYPVPGWVEHSPADIWSSVRAVISSSLSRAGLAAADIAAVGLTNQRETTIVWDRATGEPVYNAIVWQCRRTAEYCKKLVRDGFSERIYNKTGLVPDAYFSATKIKWILDNVEGARARAERGELIFGTVDAYLLWKLTGGASFCTDYTNAARTMLFNIHTLQWDEELLRLFDIPRGMLPEVKPSACNFGRIAEGELKGVSVCGVAGDQQAALFGQGCFSAGNIKNTYGTGCFLLMNTGGEPVKSENGLVTTLGATGGTRPSYVLEGSVFVGGAAVQWLRDGVKLIRSAKSSERAAIRAKSSGGVYVVPAFTGLGAPYWDGNARGTITGITRGTTRDQIVRASLEGIAYQVHDVVKAMERDAGIKIACLSVDGGASANGFLMQFQADILRARVVRSRHGESTVLGAAFLAGIAAGLWDEAAVAKILKGGERKVFTPSMEEGERLALLAGWQKAVEKARL